MASFTHGTKPMATFRHRLRLVTAPRNLQGPSNKTFVRHDNWTSDFLWSCSSSSWTRTGGTYTCQICQMFVNNVIMFSKYLWLSLLLGIISFLYSRDFVTIIVKYLTDATLTDRFDMRYFGLNEDSDGERVFTISELEQYRNMENGLYLSILGRVFDVTKGEKHYGPEGSYHAFTGRDASLAFITGEFDDKGLTDDISSLSARQVKSLNDWLQFYNTNYIYKGKLHGRYYNRDGSPTTEFDKIQEKLQLAMKEKLLEEEQKRMFPPCNVEWKPDSGTVFWCTKKSGGIERDWIGTPRMLFETTGVQGASRCACVKLDSKEYEENKARLRQYDGCAKSATRCVVQMTNNP